MARPLRIHVPGMPAHVVSRGNNKQCIFTDDRDYQKYLELLSSSLARLGARCHAFCLMWNHVHLIVRPDTQPLWRLMQQVNSHYCEWFNHRHDRVGHVVQGRYKSRLVEDGSYLLNALRYLALNPVVARKVAHPADWPWSSYRAAAGLTPVPTFLDLDGSASAFDATSWREAQERYVTFVTAPDAMETIWGPLFAGSRAAGDRIDALLTPHRTNQEFVYAERFATRPSLASLLVGAAVGAELDAAVRRAFCRHAYTLRTIATALGVHPSTIWKWTKRAERMAPDEDSGVGS
jgi:putative transposase